MTTTLLRFIETYHGSSFPTLADLVSGVPAVVKLRGAGNGAAGLLSEFVVNRLAYEAGLPVPDAIVVHLPPNFPWNYGTDEFYDLVKKSPGANLGLAVITGAKALPAESYSALPAALVSQIVTLDRTFSNWDRTELSGNIVLDERHRIWLVDHGSCRFFQPRDWEALPRLPANHRFLAQEDTFDAKWLDAIDANIVADIVGEIPADWLKDLGTTPETIAAAIHARLALARRNSA